MSAFSGRLIQSVISLYAWMAAVFLGAAWLDSVYSRQFAGENRVSGEVADVLLWIGSLTLLVGVAAIALAWQANSARLYLIASLAVLSFEFLGPVFFRLFLGETHIAGAGAGLRVAINVLASLLAFVGLGKFCVRSALENT